MFDFVTPVLGRIGLRPGRQTYRRRVCRFVTPRVRLVEVQEAPRSEVEGEDTKTVEQNPTCDSDLKAKPLSDYFRNVTPRDNERYFEVCASPETIILQDAEIRRIARRGIRTWRWYVMREVRWILRKFGCMEPLKERQRRRRVEPLNTDLQVSPRARVVWEE